jgi:cytochrome c556
MKNTIFKSFFTGTLRIHQSKLGLILVLGLTTTAVLADESDSRQVLNLSNPQRNHVLGEMRSLLAGTQMILTALTKDDMAAVAENAQALGFNMKHKAENPLHDVLPKDFIQLGMSMHKDFDLIAADAMSLKDPKHTLQQLSATMGKCIACHETYQIQMLSVDSPKR